MSFLRLKLSKTIDKHYHFVDHDSLALPFCRLEDGFQSHFADKTLFLYQMDHVNPPTMEFTEGCIWMIMDVYGH
jgi:hypothetical protein